MPDRKLRSRTHGALRYAGDVTLLALLYYLSAKLGYAFGFSGPVAAVIWLPAGVGMAYLTLRGLHCWPGVLLGDLLVNNYSTVLVSGAVGQTIGNVLEVVLAAALIRHWRRGGPLLTSVVGVVQVVAAVAAGTALSALVGPLSLIGAGVLTWRASGTVMRTWWLGDLTGALVVVPFALAWFAAAGSRWDRRRGLLPALLVLTAGLSALAMHATSPLAYLVFPALILAAMLCGARGGTAAVVVAVGFAVYGSTHFNGPFSYESVTRSVLNTQLFIAVTSVSTILVAALLSERDAMTEQVNKAVADAVRAAYEERHRLERNLHDGAQQRLLALRMHVRTLTRIVIGDDARAALEEFDDEIAAVLNELRAIARGTFPPVLTERGLAGALADIAERSPLPVVILESPRRRVDVGTEAAAYYVVTEALANAERHADPSGVWLAVGTSRTGIELAVIDDGRGTAHERPGSGLAGLRERIEQLGGTFELISSPDRGTCIRASIPVVAAAWADGA